MKLLGITDGKRIVASMGHYDCNSDNGLMMDGGQPGTLEYAGYNRWAGGVPVWFEVPQTFAELYYDYQYNTKKREFGSWSCDDVKVLDIDEIEACNSFEEKVKNCVWGTRGKNGDEPLRYVHLIDCETDHLEAIRDTQRISEERTEIINFIINSRN